MNSELEELKKDIRQSLAQGKATFALDRVQTLTIKAIRNYCVVHDIDIINDKEEKYPLHSFITIINVISYVCHLMEMV